MLRIFDLPECCVNTDLGAKVRGLFHSAVHMHADKRWLDSWAIVCKKAKLCNMHVERYFAAVRLACRHVDGAPDIERLRAVGMLREVLTSHTEAGGVDCRFTSSKHLISRGVPLRRAKQRHVKHTGLKPAGAFAKYCAKQERLRKQRGVTLATLGGRKARFRALSAQWREKPVEERHVFQAEAMVDHVRKRAAVHATDQRVEPRLIGDGFWGLSSVESPFTTEAFLDTISERLGHVPGAYEFLSVFRGDLRAGAFVADSGKFKAGDRVPQRIPCWKRHPGLCETRHAAFYAIVWLWRRDSTSLR